jgi:deoxyribonuclease V
MKIAVLHPWTQNTREALELQLELAKQVVLRPGSVEKFRWVAGADVSWRRGSSLLYASVIVWDRLQNRLLEESFAALETEFPYVPGLLSFRELPVVLEAFRKLTIIPDAVLADGQGLAHPRGLGLACHLGLWLNLPTVGCAKSRLLGEAADPGPNPGNFEPLRYKGRTVGAVLRTRARSRPLYISPGHLMDLESSVKLTQICLRRARLPEPTRRAHLSVGEYRRNHELNL